jgi:hypothetical protein
MLTPVLCQGYRLSFGRTLRLVSTAAVSSAECALSRRCKTTKDKDGAGPKAVGTDSHGWPIYAGKWYLLHEHDPDGHSYTGAFDSRAEAAADPRRHHSEVLTGEQLVARFTEWKRNP